MNKEIKFLAINNIKFDTPLSNKEAFKKYREIRKKEWIDELKNIIRANPSLDLIEDGIAKRVIILDIGSGINIKETKEG
jgi:hypothetical protein